MTVRLLLEECDCSCHAHNGAAVHSVPYCSRCPYCRKRITRGQLRHHLTHKHPRKLALST